MVKRIKLGNLNVLFVLRHRFEKSEKTFEKTFDGWKISVWSKSYKIVGKKNFKDVKRWQANLVKNYMLGLEFLFFKAWIDIDYGAMRFYPDNK